jgi:hypothetical protein
MVVVVMAMTMMMMMLISNYKKQPCWALKTNFGKY